MSGLFSDAHAPPASVPGLVPARLQTETIQDPNERDGVVGEGRRIVGGLIKSALEAPDAEAFLEALEFPVRFRRLAIWNARIVFIQRPGSVAVASEAEWQSIGRFVLPDAVPIIILWPFGPIRLIYELFDTGPLLERSETDPFAVLGQLDKKALPALIAALRKQRTFVVQVEWRRTGGARAGSAATAGHDLSISQDGQEGALSEALVCDAELSRPVYRVILSDHLSNTEAFSTLAHELGHIFCGHLGGCVAGSRDTDPSGWPDRRHLPFDGREIEAEAAAYLVCSRAGVMPQSAAYLQQHARTANLSLIDIDLVMRAAARIERLAGIRHGVIKFGP